MLRALQFITVFGVLFLLGFAAVSGLRHGRIRLRGGKVIARKKQPVLFWSSIAASVFFIMTAIVAYVHSF